MSDPADHSLSDRVAALERTVARLERALGTVPDPPVGGERSLDARAKASAPSAPAAPSSARWVPPASTSAPQLPDRSTEWWLSRVGAGLLLFGVAFLFKYAVDQGWLTPWVRVGFGVALGVALSVIGLRVPSERRWFRPVALGGAVATWYITGFAAFQVLQLVSHPVAFAFMAVVTAFAFWASLHEDLAALGVLGALGGFGTPFLLYTGAGTVPGLIAYTAIVLAGTSAIYLRAGWLTLLWSQAVGAFGVVLIAGSPWNGSAHREPADLWALQIGAILAWLACWAVPLYRLIRGLAASQKPPTDPRTPSGSRPSTAQEVPHVAVFAVATPLLALAISVHAWDLPDTAAGIVALAGTGLYAALWRRLDVRARPPILVAAHGVAAATLLTIGLGCLLEGHLLLVSWAALATLLHLVAGRRDDEMIEWAAHVLSAAVLLWLMARMLSGSVEGTAVANWRAAADAATLALALLSATAIQRPDARRAYGLIAHVGLLALLWRELARLPQGNAYVSIAWGTLGIALLIVGLRRDRADLRVVALGTLGLVVGKLFLVDLSRLQALWRIALFLGFGGVFLAVSYYLQAWWKRTR